MGNKLKIQEKICLVRNLLFGDCIYRDRNVFYTAAVCGPPTDQRGGL